jgi:hypothetical protein
MSWQGGGGGGGPMSSRGGGGAMSWHGGGGTQGGSPSSPGGDHYEDDPIINPCCKPAGARFRKPTQDDCLLRDFEYCMAQAEKCRKGCERPWWAELIGHITETGTGAETCVTCCYQFELQCFVDCVLDPISDRCKKACADMAQLPPCTEVKDWQRKACEAECEFRCAYGGLTKPGGVGPGVLAGLDCCQKYKEGGWWWY